jgi:hypothetical protein
VQCLPHAATSAEPLRRAVSHVIGSIKEDGPAKAAIDSLALRIVGGLFEYSESPRETEVHRLPIVPYAFASKFFGLFKNRREHEPQLVTGQVMYNTIGAPGADFHAMFNDVVLAQVGFLRENEGFNTYGMLRYDILDRGELTFNVSALRGADDGAD